jgi:hypothetical protein
MKDDLRELIQDARRAVRLASGVPLSPDEQAEERRLKDTKEMNLFVYEAFRFKVMNSLKSTVIWTPMGAALEMRTDEHVFHLRKDRDAYGLFAIEDRRERELLRINGNDPIFANRALVAIGDFNIEAAKPASSQTASRLSYPLPRTDLRTLVLQLPEGFHTGFCMGTVLWVLLPVEGARMCVRGRTGRDFLYAPAPIGPRALDAGNVMRIGLSNLSWRIIAN